MFSRFKKWVVSVLVALSAVVAPVVALAQQAQGPNFAPAFESVTQTFTSLMTLGLALAGVVIAGLIGLKLLKKIVSRAT